MEAGWLGVDCLEAGRLGGKHIDWRKIGSQRGLISSTFIRNKTDRLIRTNRNQYNSGSASQWRCIFVSLGWT